MLAEVAAEPVFPGEWTRPSRSAAVGPHQFFCGRVQQDAHWHGLTWSALRFHPNFAKPGLARYVDHPNPRLRHAALDDPDGGPGLVMQLIDDPDVGSRALRDPRLPSEELLRRLAIPGSARDAASNPALPPATMHQLLDLADVASLPDTQ
ncbi:hypothetical protein ABZW02_33305 [Streptomyces sp. NPDC005180]|uniref:hypothetical protein n=1 Tax=Streptomyces sp. NPDC005180 TaxID=3156868 RepID=UPI0033A20EE4